MSFSRLSAFAFALMSALLIPAAPAAVVLHPGVAQAAPNYHVGMRLRAKHECTVNGYAIKKGVVLTVASVSKGDDGKVRAADLDFKGGMTIRQVAVDDLKAHFTIAP